MHFNSIGSILISLAGKCSEDTRKKGKGAKTGASHDWRSFYLSQYDWLKGSHTTKVVWLPNETDYSYCEFVAPNAPYCSLNFLKNSALSALRHLFLIFYDRYKLQTSMSCVSCCFHWPYLVWDGYRRKVRMQPFFLSDCEIRCGRSREIWQRYCLEVLTAANRPGI